MWREGPKGNCTSGRLTPANTRGTNVTTDNLTASDNIILSLHRSLR